MTAGERMYIWFLVGLGGGLGAIARYASVRGAVELGLRPDLGTGLVNVLGSFLIGVLMTRVESLDLRLLLGTGFLGGFTTFSTFGADTMLLLDGGRPGEAAVYVGATVAVGLLACHLGQIVGRALA